METDSINAEEMRLEQAIRMKSIIMDIKRERELTAQEQEDLAAAEAMIESQGEKPEVETDATTH